MTESKSERAARIAADKRSADAKADAKALPTKAEKAGITEWACSRCKKTKPVSEFYQATRYSHGLSGWCKLCNKEYQQARRDRKAQEEK